MRDEERERPEVLAADAATTMDLALSSSHCALPATPKPREKLASSPACAIFSRRHLASFARWALMVCARLTKCTLARRSTSIEFTSLRSLWDWKSVGSLHMAKLLPRIGYWHVGPPSAWELCDGRSDARPIHEDLIPRKES